MEIIGASVVFLCDEDFGIIKDGAVAIQDGKIIAVGKYKELESSLESKLANAKSNFDFGLDFSQMQQKTKSSRAKPALQSKPKSNLKKDSQKPLHIKKQFFSDCVLLPALVNAHIHFEFGANTASFAYGSFEAWLESVMSYRGGVLEKLETTLKREIATQLNCGVGSVGAISSYGGDMLALAHSPLRVAYFCEALGANARQVSEVYERFEERFLRALELQKKLKNKRFMPRVAIHSPYSVHSELAKKVINLAKNHASQNPTNQAKNSPNQASQKPIISAHFLESASEREWLESGNGWFKRFYADTLKIPNPKPLYKISEFLEIFSQTQAVLTHCVAMSERELKAILDLGHFLSTCPRSNRLLGGKMLEIVRFQKADSRFLSHLAIGTDGASSNVNTNLLDEMRSALFGLDFADSWGLESLGKNILLSATRYGAQALGLENGELKQGRDADLAIFRIPQITDSTTPILHFLTNAKKVHKLYINGKNALKSSI